MVEEQPLTEWGSAQEALAILKEVNGRDINPKYLGKLATDGRLQRKKFDERTYIYWLPGAREIKIPKREGAGNRINHSRMKEGKHETNETAK